MIFRAHGSNLLFAVDFECASERSIGRLRSVASLRDCQFIYSIMNFMSYKLQEDNQRAMNCALKYYLDKSGLNNSKSWPLFRYFLLDAHVGQIERFEIRCEEHQSVKQL